MIVYDARFATARPTGIGRVCGEVLRGLAGLPDRPPLAVLVNRETALPEGVRSAAGIRCIDAPWNPHGLANQRRLPRLLRPTASLPSAGGCGRRPPPARLRRPRGAATWPA